MGSIDIPMILPIYTMRQCLGAELAQALGLNPNARENLHYHRSQPAYVLGRYLGRGTALAVGAAEIGIGAACLISNLGFGRATGPTSVGALIGGAGATLSAALATHVALVVTAVGIRGWIEPLPNVVFAQTGGGSDAGRPINGKDQPYPKQHVEGYGEVPFPEGPIEITDPSPMRAQYTKELRAQIRNW